jgi:hypothetical protein
MKIRHNGLKLIQDLLEYHAFSLPIPRFDITCVVRRLDLSGNQPSRKTSSDQRDETTFLTFNFHTSSIQFSYTMGVCGSKDAAAAATSAPPKGAVSLL